MPDQRNTQLPLLVDPKISDSLCLSCVSSLSFMLTLSPLYSVPIPTTYTFDSLPMLIASRLSFFFGMFSSSTPATLDNGLSRRAAPHACTVSSYVWL